MIKTKSTEELWIISWGSHQTKRMSRERRPQNLQDGSNFRGSHSVLPVLSIFHSICSFIDPRKVSGYCSSTSNSELVIETCPTGTVQMHFVLNILFPHQSSHSARHCINKGCESVRVATARSKSSRWLVPSWDLWGTSTDSTTPHCVVSTHPDGCTAYSSLCHLTPRHLEEWHDSLIQLHDRRWRQARRRRTCQRTKTGTSGGQETGSACTSANLRG